MISPLTLLSTTQHTLAKPSTWVEGTTLRNVPARIRFLPAEAGHGRTITVSQRGQTLYTFPVTLQGSGVGHTWTDALNPTTGQGVGVIEHPAAAVVLAGLDNVVMQVDYPETQATTLFYAGGKRSSVALMDGTATRYLEAIHAAGVVSQNEPRQWLTVKDKTEIHFKDSYFILEPRTEPGWGLTVLNNPTQVAWRKNETLAFTFNLHQPDTAQTLNAIATARPASYSVADWFVFRTLTLGKGRPADFCLIYSPFNHQKPISGQKPFGRDEGVHHRALDLHGDIHFFTGNLQINLTAYNATHAATNHLRHWLTTTPILTKL